MSERFFDGMGAELMSWSWRGIIWAIPSLFWATSAGYRAMPALVSSLKQAVWLKLPTLVPPLMFIDVSSGAFAIRMTNIAFQVQPEHGFLHSFPATLLTTVLQGAFLSIQLLIFAGILLGIRAVRAQFTSRALIAKA